MADQEGVTVEHIIQDSCSDDGTQDWLPTDSRVTAFIETDEGMYDAINRGLQRATGEICGYLNCDEQYLPGALAKVSTFFNNHPKVDVLFGDVVLVNTRGEPLSYRRAVLPTRQHVRLSHLNTASCATFFRRRLTERGFHFDTGWKTIGDAVWIDNLLQHEIKMATLPAPLATFTFTGINLGATGLSDSEVQEWRGPLSVARKLRMIGVIFWHRIKKALAGAYRRRRVEIDTFTLESPDKRQHFVGEKVGFGWVSQDRDL